MSINSGDVLHVMNLEEDGVWYVNSDIKALRHQKLLYT